MKVIPLGLQCSVPNGIQKANFREYSYPFDWLCSPSKTTYNVLNILINDGVEKAMEYMTTGYTYFNYIIEREQYLSVEHDSGKQMNKTTGLGNPHHTINDEFKNKLRVRLERLLRDIKSDENLLFIYADAASSCLNYYLDDVEFGLDATEYLIKIHELIRPLNNNIR